MNRSRNGSIEVIIDIHPGRLTTCNTGKILLGFLAVGLHPFWCVDSGKPYSVLGVAAVQEHQGVSINDPDNLSLQNIGEAGGGHQQQE